uniref:SGNH/GDSL hydrolase family protein n=1 Tax=Alistipes sp. D31t1_170403_E11 TaxID=2787128 RepID=UPI003977D094
MLFFQRWFAQNAPQAATAAKGLRVVFTGDSITDGNWGKADGKPSSQRNLWDRNHLFGSGYMYLCATYYQGYFPDRDYLFFNRGTGGNALGDLAARWQEDVLDLRPDVLSVLIGTNDVERHLRKLLRADDPQAVSDFDFAGWEKTYRRLLDEARQANPALRIVLCTPFAAPCGKIVEGELGAYYPLRQQMLAQCCAIVAEIARDYGATLVPFHRLIAGLESRLPNGDETYWVWDGIHPTPAGQRLMADCWIGAAARSGAME